MYISSDGIMMDNKKKNKKKKMIKNKINPSHHGSFQGANKLHEAI